MQPPTSKRKMEAPDVSIAIVMSERKRKVSPMIIVVCSSTFFISPLYRSRISSEPVAYAMNVMHT